MKKILLFILSIFSALGFTKKHPYHVGSMELNYTKKTQTFQITGRFFTDDLESAINHKYSKNLHFGDQKDTSELKKILKEYVHEYFKLKVNGNLVDIKFIGYEEDKEAVDIFLESENITVPKKVETAVSILYNQFNDQINIVHIIVDGQRKSEKLTYPNRYLYQQF